MAIDIW